jgi:hypothetical protein
VIACFVLLSLLLVSRVADSLAISCE